MDGNQREKIEAYLHGRLEPAEARAFEEAYLHDPELLDEVMLAETLKDGLAGRADARARSPKPRGRFWATPQYAAAASVLLGLFVLSTGVLYVDNRELRDDGTMLASTRLVPLVAVRGQDDIELGSFADDEWAVLMADPGFAEFDAYEAVVARDDGGEPVWRSRDLIPTYEGLLAIGLPGARLDAGNYRLSIAGRMDEWPEGRASEPAGAYTFSIAAP